MADAQTQAALEAGFASDQCDPADCPHYYSSPLWEAWIMGRFIRSSGRALTGVRPSRGSTFKAGNGEAWRLTYGRRPGNYTIAKVS